MTGSDDVEQLLEQLKALPLVDGADLDRPLAAYYAFEAVLSAVLRAAIAPERRSARDRKNGKLFQEFVCRDFPVGRGWSDPHYARQLWKLRGMFVKEMRTGSFRLKHGQPEYHFLAADDGRLILNLESLIEDFRYAVTRLGPILRRSDRLRQHAADELALRTVHMTDSASITHSSTVVDFRPVLAAKAASGTN